VSSIPSASRSAGGSNRLHEATLTLDAVADYGNLHRAFLKASQGRRKRHDIACFGMHWEEHLLQLRDDLLSGHYRPGGYKLFTMHEKKTRLIMAAPFIDRIVHHAVCNLLTPVLERSMVASSCANRVGKGTSAGLELFGKFAHRFDYVLKCDIRRFFASIDRAVLMESLRPKISDRRLYELVSAIIAIAPEYGVEFDYFPEDSLEKISVEIGVSKPTLISWSLEMAREIANMEYFDRQALLEQHKLDQRARIEAAAKRLKKIRDAIDDRDFNKEALKDLAVMEKRCEARLSAELKSTQAYTGHSCAWSETVRTDDIEHEKTFGINMPTVEV